MKKIIIFTFAMMALCAVSCDKDRTGSGSSANKLVKEISYSYPNSNPQYSDSWHTTFEYDGEGRLTKVVEIAQNGDTLRSTFSYDGNIINEYFEYIDIAGIPVSRTSYSKYYLDGDGYLTRIDSDDSNTSSTYKYENGLLKGFFSEGYMSNEYGWENGDIITSKIAYVNSISGTTTYEYTDIKDNFNIDFFTWSGVYLNLKGTRSTHLPKISTYNNSYGSYTTDYSYEFDADGCVTKIIMTDRDDSSYREEYNIIYY